MLDGRKSGRQEIYFLATRHPWPCLLFLLPLLIAYESGVVWLGGAHPETLRNGLDAWLRWGLEASGVQPLYLPPGVIAAVFLVWGVHQWAQRPADLGGVVIGMAIESLLFALGLWVLSQGLVPLLAKVGAAMATPGPASPGVGQVITYVGAGIYEEVVFRLLLFTVLARLLRLLQAPWPLSTLTAALSSAALFSAAHHVGPYGEPYQASVFLFRLLAGLYFALVYQVRGFGIAVGAHACYDVLVGVAVG
jgi:membrane protease YdiL (CAAX protease family)